MPYQMLCNGTEQKSPKARPGLGLAPSRCTSLHNDRYGIFNLGSITCHSLIVQKQFYHIQDASDSH